jgi:hypothetical protein
LRVTWVAWRADSDRMNNPLRSILKSRRLVAVALAVAAVPFAASPASAASHGRWHHGKHATSAAVTVTPVVAAPAAAPTTAPSVTSVISIGGYVFYNLTYAEAVDAWAAAVAAAPAGYVPPTVYSVSVDTTVSGTVEDGNH